MAKRRSGDTLPKSGRKYPNETAHLPAKEEKKSSCRRKNVCHSAVASLNQTRHTQNKEKGKKKKSQPGTRRKRAPRPLSAEQKRKIKIFRRGKRTAGTCCRFPRNTKKGTEGGRE